MAIPIERKSNVSGRLFGLTRTRSFRPNSLGHTSNQVALHPRDHHSLKEVSSVYKFPNIRKQLCSKRRIRIMLWEKFLRIRCAGWPFVILYQAFSSLQPPWGFSLHHAFDCPAPIHPRPARAGLCFYFPVPLSTTASPSCRLSAPAITTLSPSASPSRISTRDSFWAPIFTTFLVAILPVPTV